MTQLSDHFSLAELTVSDTAKRLGIPNTPTTDHMHNLTMVLAPGLERVRAVIGGPVLVTSGYRNPRVNAAVGGVANSAHALGYAADITHPRYTALAVARMLRDHLRGHFDQLILESSRGVVHISFDPRARRQVMTQAGAAGSSIVYGLPAS